MPAAEVRVPAAGSRFCPLFTFHAAYALHFVVLGACLSINVHAPEARMPAAAALLFMLCESVSADARLEGSIYVCS